MSFSIGAPVGEPGEGVRLPGILIDSWRAQTQLLFYSKAIHQLQLRVQLLSKVLILDRKGNANEEKC